ncbi:MAG: glutathione-disulfide reductase, partial [Phenylobacterium sp.]
VYGAHYRHDFEDSAGFGWSVPEPKHDWKKLQAAKDKELDRLNGVYKRLLRDTGVQLIEGRGRIVDPHTVEVAGQRYTAAHILVSTGSHPLLPELPGIEHVLTSDGALSLQELPRRIIIVGGGYIGVEFAGIFNALGVKVTVLIRGDTVLRGFDDDVRSHLTEEMEKRGITVVLAAQHTSIEKTAGGLLSKLSNGHEIESDVVMLSLGREPYVDGLGLETAGVELTEKGAVKVDEFSRTNVANIWAVGDVTDRINLTPVAIREGAAFAETEFNNRPTSFDHEMVASAVFSQPPIGSVGLSEADARKQYGKVDIYLARLKPMKYAFSHSDERALLKLVVDCETERLLGCHVVGPDAPEIIQMAAIALKMGVTKTQWDATCAVHPTMSEELVTMREKHVPMGLGQVA